MNIKAKLAVSVAFLMVPHIAHAEDAAPSAVDAVVDGGGEAPDIVVTGSRLRNEAAQQTPIAVSVVGETTIRDLHAATTTALTSLVPNLLITPNATADGGAAIFLRGFGVLTGDISAEPGIAQYIDGVYQATNSGSLASLFDVERVEVLRGPQSALLGKNASAGAILIRRIRPNVDAFEGRVGVEYGTYNLAQVQGRVSVPLVQGVLAAQLSGTYRRRDGYIENIFPGGRDGGAEDTHSIRGALNFKPTPDLEIYISADYTGRNPSQTHPRNISPSTANPCVVFGLCTNLANRVRVTNSNFDGKGHTDDYNISANADWTLGGVKLTSITGYRKFKMYNAGDIDSSPVRALEAEQKFDIKHVSQELRLSSVENAGLDFGGRFSWLIGGYYDHNTANMQQVQYVTSAPTAALRTVFQDQRTIRTSHSLFGQADFKITDSLSVSAGGRWARDEIKHLFNLPGLGGFPTSNPGFTYGQKNAFESETFEAGANYKLDSSKMVYFRYSEGFRGGGFVGFPTSLDQAYGVGVRPAPGEVLRSGGFGPERSTGYEVGAKTTFLDGKLLLNLTLFTATYDGLQRTRATPNGAGGFVVLTENIAKARTRGVEFETIIRPTQGLQIRGSAGYLDAKYLNYTVNGVDLRSTPFLFAPKWTLNLTPSYEMKLNGNFIGFDTVRIQGKVDYGSARSVSVTAFTPLLNQPGYGTFDAQVSLLGGDTSRYEINAFVQNITNKNYKIFGAAVGNIVTYAVDNPGRLFGVSASLNF